MYFGKGTRVTSTDLIIRNAKKNKVGPGQYKMPNKQKIKGLSKISMRKSVAFIDDAEYKAKNMPGFYKIKEIRKRVLTPDFKKFGKERDVKIVKKKGIAPGSYQMEDSFYKTQVVVRK